jgi:hypothetical protein
MTDHETHENHDLKRELGITRRGLMKRGAVVGGTLIWAAPVIQSLSPPAFAHVVSPVNHFCCHCFNANRARSTVTLTSGYCLSDGGFFPDGHSANAQHCVEHCTALGFDSNDFQAGPNPFGCLPTHPTNNGGCIDAGFEGDH